MTSIRRLTAVAALFAALLFPAPARAQDGETAAPSARERIFAAADSVADELLAAPTEDLPRREIAMAFGWIYLNNMLGGSSENKAERYLTLALDEGLPEAGVVLGAIYMAAVPVPGQTRDVEKAIAYYNRAADGGCVDAFRILGTIYSDGEEEVEPDPEKGRTYLLEAARRGSETAIARLTPLLGQDGVPADADALIDADLVAAARERSDRIVRSTAKIFDLLEQRLGQLELKIESETPEVPLADLSRMSPEEQAMYWEKLTLAVDEACRDIVAGQPDDKTMGDAALVIGILHHLGFLYGSDPEKAREFMELALEKGIVESRVTLGELHLDLTLQENGLAERDVAKGLEHLKLAAEADCADAQRLLGLLYANGAEGIEPDPEEAERYMLAAARHGDMVALESLEPVFARAREWERDHPGEISPLPKKPEDVVVPELAEAARKRQKELSEVAERINKELNDRIRKAVLPEDKR